ncbi:hypothetical protein [Marinobacter sp. P4B1]|uniref:hypothetical protein n=1 Tax=Marinobacter sp. P4B1 TaxID=1119533 RepID=UPI00071C7A61|nr:hypothetical protein [Marinobacter sp. P4B1]KRW83655.1 hypothetical protein AQ621_16535 [Marinobacter sp. P4B1]
MSFAGTAIELWEKLTGTKVNARSFSGSIGQSFSLFQANQKIQQAQALNDDTAVTLIIRQLLADYTQSVSFRFTLADLLESVPDDFERMVEPARELQTFLNSDDIRGAHDAFFIDCLDALAHYRNQPVSSTTEQTRAFVEHQSGLIGLDAHQDLEKLTKLTMFDGDAAENEPPKINRLIFAFETLEELIDHGASIPSGFSLCAITSSHISDSYFVLVVRSGERVIIVTDKGTYTHPLQQARMRNRNDRYNLDRIENSRFPYDLLNIQWSDNGRRAAQGSGSRDITVSDTGFRVLGAISDLDDWDLLWLHLFIEQCRQRYFVEGVIEPVMATGSMIQLTHSLAGDDRYPVPASQRFEIETRTSTELSTDFMHSIEPDWQDRANPNGWMEERFAGEVPEDSLYIPPSALSSHDEVVLISKDGEEPEISAIDTREMSFFDKERLSTINLQPIDPFALATKERIVRDAHFLARHNQSKVIEKLVKADYKSRKREVIEWFNKAVADHLPNFVDELLALNHEYFFVDCEAFEGIVDALKGRPSFSGIQTRSGTRQREILVDYEPLAKQRVFNRSIEEATPQIKHHLGLVDYEEQRHLCYLDNDETAKVFLYLSVANVADIMKLTGLSLEQIPPELHSRGIDVYTGNSILDRIDPLATLRNPWDKLPLHFCLPVSLKGFKAWRKARGLDTPKAPDLPAWSRQKAREMWVRYNQEGDTAELGR